MVKRLALATFAAVAGLAGIAASAGSANAEPLTPGPVTGYVKDYTTSFTSPSDTSVAVHHLDPGTTVDTYCFRNGQAHGGQAAWFAINHDGETAYVHSSALSVSTTLPHC